MTTKTFEAGQWIIREGAISGTFIYKLIKGKVSIYEGGKLINTMEVKEGSSPKFIGILAALSDDWIRRASVKTETEVEVQELYIDQFKKILKHDVPEDRKKDIYIMIDTIVTGSQIRSLRRKIAESPHIKLQIPHNISPEVSEVLHELIELYDDIVEENETPG